MISDYIFTCRRDMFSQARALSVYCTTIVKSRNYYLLVFKIISSFQTHDCIDLGTQGVPTHNSGEEVHKCIWKLAKSILIEVGSDNKSCYVRNLWL